MKPFFLYGKNGRVNYHQPKNGMKKLIIIFFLGLFMVIQYAGADDDTLSKQMIEKINGDDLVQYMQDIISFSLLSRDDGDILWGRQVGTKYEKMTSDYMKNHFETANLNRVWQEEFPIREEQWSPTEIELTLIGGSSPSVPDHDIRFATAMTSVDARVSTPPSGIEAEIVDIGYGTEQDLKGVDIEGKIVLVHRDFKYSIFSSYARDIQQTAFIDQNKAVGAVFAFHRSIESNMKVASWNGPRARKIPHVNIGSQDAQYLQKIITGSASSPRVRLKIRGKIEKDLITQNTYGLIKGKKQNEYVVLIAHTDAWFEGATDNASGLAVMVALSKCLSRLPRETIQRNILFVATAGHHNGPATGTFHMVHKNREILDKTILLINMEHMASIGPLLEDPGSSTFEETKHILFETHQSPFIRETVLTAAEKYGTPVIPTPSKSYIGDMAPFQVIGQHGIPSFCLLQPAYWYHTEEDRISRISRSGIEHVAKTLADVLYAINKATNDEIRHNWNPPINRFYKKYN